MVPVEVPVVVPLSVLGLLTRSLTGGPFGSRKTRIPYSPGRSKPREVFRGVRDLERGGTTLVQIGRGSLRPERDREDRSSFFEKEVRTQVPSYRSAGNRSPI